MILSAGLTPAWQQILLFDSFRYGEVNRAREAHWFSSGKVFNAGIAAHQLGGPSLTLAPVGGPPRAEIEHEFDRMGLPYRWVVTESATRVCTTLIDRATGTITELVENGRPVTPEELDAFRRAYAEEAARAAVAVIIGSLPAGTPASFYRDLLEQTPCPAVLDFRGEGRVACLHLEPPVVKPNREELARTVIPFNFGDVTPVLFDCNAEQKENYLLPVLRRQKYAYLALMESGKRADLSSMGLVGCTYPDLYERKTRKIRKLKSPVIIGIQYIT